MIALTRLSLRRRSVTLLLAVIVLLGGAMALRSLNQELFPSYDAPYLVVTAAQPGASPEAVVEGVTEPVEDMLRAGPGVRHVDSTSLEGLAFVTAEYEPGTDMARRQDSVRERLAALELPDGVEKPTVERLSPDSFPVYTLALTGDDDTEVERYVDTTLRPALSGVDGVASVTKTGGTDSVVTVTADPVKLGEVGLAPGAVADALRNANLSVPAGGVSAEGSQLPVQVTASLSSIGEVQALPVGARAGRPPITVAEVATVETGAGGAGVTISRSGGRPAISLEVRRQQSASVLETVSRVKQVLGEHGPPDGVQVGEVLNQAQPVRDAVNGFGRDAVIGTLLAVGALLFFLRGLRPVLVAGASIPVALFVAFLFMRAGHVSLNLLTLGALAVAAARVIDNAVVIVESIHRRLEQGQAKAEAVPGGTADVGPAITASTLCTLAVFLPLAVVGGLTGAVFVGFAVTVAGGLLAGLLVAVTVIPVLADLLIRERRPGNGAALPAPGGYGARLAWALDHRSSALLLAGAALVVSLLAAMSLPTNVYPPGDTKGLLISVSAPAGSGLRNTASRITPLEDRLRSLPGVDAFTTVVGTPASGSDAFFGAVGGSGSARILVGLGKGADVDGLRRRIETLVSSLSLTGTVSVLGSELSSQNLTVTVTGDEFERVRTGAADVQQALRDVAGVGHVSSNVASERVRLVVKVNPGRAAAAGMATPTVTRAVQEALSPIPAGKVLIGGSARELVVSVASDRYAGDLRQLPVAPGVNLGQVAEVFPAQSATALSRHDGVRSAEVRAVVTSPDTGGITGRVRDRLADVNLPGGVELRLGGLAEVQRGSFHSLALAMALALLLLYIGMAVCFGSLLTPLVVLLALPLAAVGAFPALLVTGHELGVPALVGLLMLVGVVVPNAIALVDFVERKRGEGLGLNEALLAGGDRQARPILMTAMATTAALLPFAVGLSEGSAMSAGLAVVVIGGLLSSTLLTLVVVPVGYSLAADLRASVTRREAEARAEHEAVPDEGAWEVLVGQEAQALAPSLATVWAGRDDEAFVPFLTTGEVVEPIGSAAHMPVGEDDADEELEDLLARVAAHDDDLAELRALVADGAIVDEPPAPGPDEAGWEDDVLMPVLPPAAMPDTEAEADIDVDGQVPFCRPPVEDDDEAVVLLPATLLTGDEEDAVILLPPTPDDDEAVVLLPAPDLDETVDDDDAVVLLLPGEGDEEAVILLPPSDERAPALLAPPLHAAVVPPPPPPSPLAPPLDPGDAPALLPPPPPLPPAGHEVGALVFLRPEVGPGEGIEPPPLNGDHGTNSNGTHSAVKRGRHRLPGIRSGSGRRKRRPDSDDPVAGAEPEDLLALRPRGRDRHDSAEVIDLSVWAAPSPAPPPDDPAPAPEDGWTRPGDPD